MRQVQRVTANYSADLFGICSALYELGGLIVMHDASGCNSTYATHDEPRWYDMDSMIYISALEEYNVVLGNDQKLIDDVCECAEEKHPKFIAVFGSPIALMCGTDFTGIARLIEDRTGIPTFGFQTSGMATYQRGARQAFAGIAERFCPEAVKKAAIDRKSVNLLGVTPLDFSVVGNVEALYAFCEEADLSVHTCWAMGNSLEQLTTAGEADVSLVVSSIGLDAAKVLQKKYGTPYVVGLPIGPSATVRLTELLHRAAETGENQILTDEPAYHPAGEDTRTMLLIGEPVQTTALRFCLEHDLGLSQVSVICPLEDDAGLLRPTDHRTDEEDDIRTLASSADLFLADPIYERVLPKNGKTRFLRLPHEAYSGRMWRAEIPVFVDPDFDAWVSARL